jgi:hypothetical protein
MYAATNLLIGNAAPKRKARSVMPTPKQIFDNRFLTMDRLLLGDRIVRQHRDGECTPEAVWWAGHPQIGRPRPWISTCKWLLSRNLITEGLRPRDSTYRGYTHVKMFVATPGAAAIFWDFAPQAANAAPGQGPEQTKKPPPP